MFAIRVYGGMGGINILIRTVSCLLTGLWKQQLIYDDVVRVDFICGEFLYEPFRLVQREKLGYAHADERCLFLCGTRRLPRK
jgi:hypothetical protein